MFEEATDLLVEDDDALVRAAVARAIASRSFALGDDALHPTSGQRVPLRLVGVHGLLAVASCPLRHARYRGVSPVHAGAWTSTRISPALLYVLRDPLAAELHRLHGCAEHVCVFVPDARGGRFEALPWPGRLETAGLTPREADVLALLLARRTNDEIAAHLVVSPATVRAHCRSILRKIGVADRRALWSQLPVGPIA